MIIRYLISVFGRDRPGLVAGLTEILYNYGANLGDVEMTRLGGAFALILEFEDPEGNKKSIDGELAGFSSECSLSYNLVPADPYQDSYQVREADTIITIYGADHPGIVFGITEVLGEKDVNISNLQTSLREEEELYIMVLEAQRPAEVSLDNLEGELERVAGELDVNVTVRELDAPEL
ncbi:MAG: glycine cleavage system protein R [bacterium]